MRGRARAAEVVAIAAVCAAWAAPASADTVRVGNAVARISGQSATLASPRIERRWTIGATAASTSALVDPATGINWSATDSPDFALALDGVPTAPGSYWTLASVTAQRTVADPARPAAGAGVELFFKYLLAGTPLVELDRTYSLYPGAAIIGVGSRQVNGSPLPVRVGAYTLDQVSSTVPA